MPHTSEPNFHCDFTNNFINIVKPLMSINTNVSIATIPPSKKVNKKLTKEVNGI